ncbi:MAG: ABC transporter ATP-binding protein/permease [Lachnobacterium sp.]|nr:ABC transporter ATP-binding protein/permease [Lachnobacterium sp.]
MAVNSFREDEQMDASDTGKVVLRLFGYLRDYKKDVVIVLIAMAVTVGISLLNPLLIEEAIDHYVADKDMNGLLKLVAFAATVNLVYVVMVKVRIYVMSLISNNIILKVRNEVYEHIQTLSFSFFDSRPNGKILARIMGDVNSLKDVLAKAVTNIIPNTITIIGVIVIMLMKDWRLALAAMCTLPFMAIAIYMVEKSNHIRWQVVRKKGSNVNAYVHESIAGMRVVQSLNAQDETRTQFEKLTDEHRDSFIYACRVADLFFPVIDMSWGIGMMVLYLVGVKIIGAPEVSLGLLVAFGTYTGMFWEPIMNLSTFFNQLITNLSAAERVFDIMDTESDLTDEPDAFELPDIKGEVAFNNVSFTYDEGTESETKVLDNVSFTAKPGETIALVGPTGAGKTTIVNLISRFYDIQKGSITIDGYDLKKVTMNSLRKQMGVMTQDNFIFHGTVRENIAYGKLNATDEEIIRAAKAVDAHDFIMKMEKGYDTELKEQGAGLSIGQRQLIAFARTMISEPKILILDEATSSIDTHTELMVQKGIEALLKGRTSFVIAHRLSTIQNADRIFVIDQGGIREQGSPAELLEKKGAYYKLYMAQFAEM